MTFQNQWHRKTALDVSLLREVSSTRNTFTQQTIRSAEERKATNEEYAVPMSPDKARANSAADAGRRSCALSATQASAPSRVVRASALADWLTPL
jgi:hypothetical protein